MTRSAKVPRLFLVGLLVLAAGFFAGCRRRAPEALERLAVPPLENLSDDASLGWVGWALSEAVAAQTTGSPRLHVIRSVNPRDAAADGATAVLRGYYADAPGRLRIHVSREDLRTNRSTGVLSVDEPFPEGLLRAADAIARWASPDAHAFDTRSLDAWRAVAEGRMAREPEVAEAAFARSAAADPEFGGAYVAWARSLLLRGDRAGVQTVFSRAQPHADRFAPVRRAELELLAATAAGDAPRRRKSLEAISRVTPADADVLRQLAREDYGARQFAASAAGFRRALALESADALSWNQLGYAEAFAGNLAGARDALEQYRKLAPESANPLDSLGEVHYYAGAFAEAEKFYLEASEKAPRFLGGAPLYKAARARLMTGDIAGADELFRRYTKALNPQDALLAYRQAQWLYLSGRRDEGRAQMGKTAEAAPSPDVRSLAAVQMAVWGLDAGAAADAAAWTRRAVETAAAPVSRQLAAMCLAASGAPVPAGVLPPPLEKRATAYRLLLARRFAEAIPVLKELAPLPDPAGADRVDVLLAWALVETGKTAEAAPLVATNLIPSAGMEDAFFALSFPRVLQLRAAVLAGQGKQQESGAAMQLYRKLGGR